MPHGWRIARLPTEGFAIAVPRTWSVATGKDIDAPASDTAIRLDTWGPPAKHPVGPGVTADWTPDVQVRVFQMSPGDTAKIAAQNSRASMLKQGFSSMIPVRALSLPAGPGYTFTVGGHAAEVGKVFVTEVAIESGSRVFLITFQGEMPDMLRYGANPERNDLFRTFALTGPASPRESVSGSVPPAIYCSAIATLRDTIQAARAGTLTPKVLVSNLQGISDDLDTAAGTMGKQIEGIQIWLARAIIASVTKVTAADMARVWDEIEKQLQSAPACG